MKHLLGGSVLDIVIALVAVIIMMWSHWSEVKLPMIILLLSENSICLTVFFICGFQKNVLGKGEDCYSSKIIFTSLSKKFFLLKFSWLTILCYFLLESEVIQLHTYTYPFPYRLSQNTEYISLCYRAGPWCRSGSFIFSSMLLKSHFDLKVCSVFSS